VGIFKGKKERLLLKLFFTDVSFFLPYSLQEVFANGNVPLHREQMRFELYIPFSIDATLDGKIAAC
jgi:hypothetical protein